jgi:rubredoxin
MKIYCPACGKTSEIEPFDEFVLSPVETEDYWECPECDSMFTFDIQYKEV